jgi:uncharacterized ferredoxin-like protein
MMNFDNRIVYHLDVVARKLGVTNADFVMGIALTAPGKSIYFDP